MTLVQIDQSGSLDEHALDRPLLARSGPSSAIDFTGRNAPPIISPRHSPRRRRRGRGA